MDEIYEHGIRWNTEDISLHANTLINMPPACLVKKMKECRGGVKSFERGTFPMKYGRKHLKQCRLTTDEFTALLAKMMTMPECELWLDVYFDSYSNHRSLLPEFLYCFGFGHLMQQECLEDINELRQSMWFHMSCIEYDFYDTDDEALDPKLAHTPEIVYKLSEQFPYIYRPVPEPAIEQMMSPEEKFNLLLTCAYSCNRQQRYFEAWAFSLSAMDSLCGRFAVKLMENTLFCQVAISSAHLAVSADSTWRALEEALASQICYGQRWEWICACQEVHVAFGLFDDERRLYEKCKDEIPKQSWWHELLVDTHLESLAHQIENRLVKCVALATLRRDPKVDDSDLKFLRMTINEMNRCAERLAISGAARFYKGLVFFYRSMVQDAPQVVSSYVASARMELRGSLDQLPSQDRRRTIALNILSYIEEGNPRLTDDVVTTWQVRTRTTWSTAASEILIKLSLFCIINRDECASEWNFVESLVYDARDEYQSATQKRGYRQGVFQVLQMFHTPAPPYTGTIQNVSEEHLLQRLKGDPEVWSRKKPEPTEDRAKRTLMSTNFVHANRACEQAYCVGLRTCKMRSSNFNNNN